MNELSEYHGATPSSDRSAVRYVVNMSYKSSGDIAAAVPEAVVIEVNGKVAAKLSVPMELGDWSLEEDITDLLAPGVANEVSITTNVYRFELLGAWIKTESEIRLRLGRRRLFKQRYQCWSGYRQARERLLIPDNRAAP